MRVQRTWAPKHRHHSKHAGRHHLELFLVVTMWDRFIIKIQTQFRLFGGTTIKRHAFSSTIVDTGITGHYLVPSVRQYCTDIQTTYTGPSLRVENGTNIKSLTRATTPFSAKLSQESQVGHIFDNLKYGYLISIGQVCGNDCVAIFTKYHVNIVKNGKIIIGGQQNPSNGLWNIPLAPKSRLISFPQPPQTQKPQHHLANGSIRHAKKKANLPLSSTGAPSALSHQLFSVSSNTDTSRLGQA